MHPRKENDNIGNRINLSGTCMVDLQLQLPLSVQLRDEATFANYLPGSNQALCGLLYQTSRPSNLAPEQFIYIYGASGAGCTHLLQAVCYEAHQAGKRSIYLPMKEIIHHSLKLLEGIENLDLICIDDVHEVAGCPLWEEAIFHLYNRVKETGKCLLIAGNAAPRQLTLTLQDLASRLSWGITMQVHPLSDAEKRQALCLRARLRGLELSDVTARYIMHHGSRNMHYLFNILARLDSASLRAKRKLSIPFVKDVMRAHSEKQEEKH